MEHGFLVDFSPQSFVIISEAFPFWILGMEPSMVSHLHFPSVENALDLRLLSKIRDVRSPLVTKAVTYLGLTKLRFGSTGTTQDIHLVSGSLDFLFRFASTAPPDTRALLVLTDSWRANRLPRRKRSLIRWFRKDHGKFGGSTDFVYLFGVLGIDINPWTSELTRNIGHVFDHGLPPQRTTRALPTAAITLNDRLSVTNMQAQVGFRTHFARDGWGLRMLTPDKLGIAFGLTQRFRVGLTDASPFPFPPVQGLHGWLGALTCSQRAHSQLLPPVRRRPIQTPTAHTWFPDLSLALSHSWIDKQTVSDKAVKHDDAGAPTQLWNNRILLLFPSAHRLLHHDTEPLRNLCLCAWRRSLTNEFRRYMRRTHGPDWRSLLTVARQLRRTGGLGASPHKSTLELLLDGDVGQDALEKTSDSDWWSWTRGSTLLFWRWPLGTQRQSARDGMQPYIQGPFPNYQARARPTKPDVYHLLLPKLQKIIRRGYVRISKTPKFIHSYINYFIVPKADDVRPVYNGTSCGFNAAVWAPNFWLPTAKSATRVLDFNYCGVDIDLGEMFLNFPLPKAFRPFSGIDISQFKTDLNDKTGQSCSSIARPDFRVRWERCWMGFRPSPYYAVRFYYWAEEIVRGDRRDPKNLLRWDRVLLNLPGSPSFDPSRPRVAKWNDLWDNIAADVLAFVDDLRASGPTEEIAWQVARIIAAGLQRLGIQDAPRKRRAPVRTTGAWAGALFSTIDEKISQSVTTEKWEKGKAAIQSLFDAIDTGNGEISYKMLERVRGFLCHLSMTFEVITPFLKGFHLILAKHLPRRDGEGWKLSEKHYLGYVHQQLAEGKISEKEATFMLSESEQGVTDPPLTVTPTTRLKQDLVALRELLKPTYPPEVLIRSNAVLQVLYGFGDASGRGFGSTMLSSEGVRYRIGLWEKDAEDSSSNWREFENVVETLEEEGRLGSLNGTLVYFFTDNSTVEAALYRGNSSSPKLFSLVVRFRKLETHHQAKFLVSHVSGKRMCAQGSDGVSRGQLGEGVTAGEDMLSFIPLNQTPLERSPSLKAWIQSWAGSQTEFLTPEGWYERGHDHIGGELDEHGRWKPILKPGTFVWSPPPAAAGVALEELRKARIKRQDSTHIIVIPRLLTPEWLRQVHKASDVVFEIPLASSLLPGNAAEPRRCSQWRGKCQVCSKKRAWLQGIFCANFYWSVGGFPACHRMWCGACYSSTNDLNFHINKLTDEEEFASADPADQPRLQKAWGRKARNEDDYLTARDGDCALIPFECDLCIFRKLTKKAQPNPLDPQHSLLMGCIRRLNLDAFWSRSRATARGNCEKLKQGLKLSLLVGLDGPYNNEGPYPPYDHVGYEIGIQMLLMSRRKGRHSLTHLQYDTIRKLRTVYGNQLRAAPQSNKFTLSMGDAKGRYTRLSYDKCGSLWFTRFLEGCQRRMGQIWKPNQALATDLLLEVLTQVEDRIEGAPSTLDENRWTVLHTLIVITYVLSLRGPEGFLLDVGSLKRFRSRQHFHEGAEYLIITLRGKIKGEHQQREHLLPCAPKTKSGVNVRESIDRLLSLKQRQGRISGPAISDEAGTILSARTMDDSLHEVLEDVFENKRSLFPATIASLEEVRKRYQIFRSFRRSSDTRALDQRVAQTDIDIVNRWSTVEKAKGRRPNQSMRQYYADIMLLIKPFTRYTESM